MLDKVNEMRDVKNRVVFLVKENNDLKERLKELTSNTKKKNGGTSSTEKKKDLNANYQHPFPC